MSDSYRFGERTDHPPNRRGKAVKPADILAQLYPMPLGAVNMGTVLQKNGHDVCIKDFLVPACSAVGGPLPYHAEKTREIK